MGINETIKTSVTTDVLIANQRMYIIIFVYYHSNYTKIKLNAILN